jgi:hypothetical protein
MVLPPARIAQRRADVLNEIAVFFEARGASSLTSAWPAPWMELVGR